jgi:hypothetical protein
MTAQCDGCLFTKMIFVTGTEQERCQVATSIAVSVAAHDNADSCWRTA